MKVDPAAKDLSFTSKTSCPEVTVSGTPNADGFLIDIAYPQKNGNNNFPTSCVSVIVAVPPTYAFDPAFQLGAKLMGVSAIIDTGNLAIASLDVSSMSGDVEATNVTVSNEINISTMSGGVKLSKVDGTFSKAKVSSMSGDVNVSDVGSSTSSANFNINSMSGTVNVNLVSIHFTLESFKN